MKARIVMVNGSMTVHLIKTEQFDLETNPLNRVCYEPFQLIEDQYDSRHWHPRRFIGIVLICAGLLGAAMYMQLVLDMLPCPLCVIQRCASY